MNMIPPLTSGWGQVPAAAFFAWQPELGGLRALILGQFNQPSGSIWTDMRNALSPLDSNVWEISRIPRLPRLHRPMR